MVLKNPSNRKTVRVNCKKSRGGAYKPTRSRRTYSRSKRHTSLKEKAISAFRNINQKARILFIRLSIICLVGIFCYFVYIYFVVPYSLKWQALNGNEMYPEGFSIHGIDISHHQGDIDWHKVKNATVNGETISFIFIKATEGEIILIKISTTISIKQETMVSYAVHIIISNLMCQPLYKLNTFLNRFILKRVTFPPCLISRRKAIFLWKIYEKLHLLG